MKRYLPFTLIIAFFISCVSFMRCQSNTDINNKSENTEQDEQLAVFNTLKAKADSAMIYCKKNGFNTK